MQLQTNGSRVRVNARANDKVVIKKTRRIIPKAHKKDEDADEPYRKSEVTAIMAHLSYMSGSNFSIDTVPRRLLANALGVSRFTIWRCIRDVRAMLDLALEVKKQSVAGQAEMETRRVRARKASRQRYNQKRREVARLEREAKTHPGNRKIKAK